MTWLSHWSCDAHVPDVGGAREREDVGAASGLSTNVHLAGGHDQAWPVPGGDPVKVCGHRTSATMTSQRVCACLQAVWPGYPSRQPRVLAAGQL
jgi:hypothetical protein